MDSMMVSSDRFLELMATFNVVACISMTPVWKSAKGNPTRVQLHEKTSPIRFQRKNKDKIGDPNRSNHVKPSPNQRQLTLIGEPVTGSIPVPISQIIYC